MIYFVLNYPLIFYKIYYFCVSMFAKVRVLIGGTYLANFLLSDGYPDYYLLDLLSST